MKWSDDAYFSDYKSCYSKKCQTDLGRLDDAKLRKKGDDLI